MIDDLMDLATRAADQADAVVKTDSTTSLRFHDGALQGADYSEATGANLRMVVDGRIGGAGTTKTEATALVEAAIAAARLGDECRLFYPEPAPSAEPRVHDAAAATADIEDLELGGVLIGDQLADDRTTVDVHLERSIGSVHVVTTRGVDRYYETTGVALDVTVTRTHGERPVTARAWWGGTGLLDDGDVASIVQDLQQRLAWGENAATIPEGPAVVCLTPRAVASVLVPLRRALRGTALHHGTSPLRDKMGTRVVDERITLDDSQTMAVIGKMIKQRRDSIKAYQEAGRKELEEQEAYEIDVLQAYLPTPLTDAELETMIKDAIAETDASSMKDMGKVMGILKDNAQGRVEMGQLSAKIKTLLSS